MEQSSASSPASLAAPKQKKNKYAIQFGYCGAGYHGLQSNRDPEHTTIEDVLVRGLHAAGLISADNMDDPLHKTGWQRASRTDKGVSALRNLVSAKLREDPNGDDVALVAVNAALPADVRVYGLQPVTSSFSSHLHCTGREYEYYLPTFALLRPEQYEQLMPESIAPSRPTREMMADRRPALDAAGEKRQQREGEEELHGGAPQQPPQPSAEDSRTADPQAEQADDEEDAAAELTRDERYFMFKWIPADIMGALRAVRISSETLELTRSLFSHYVGTHSYHNFTPKGDPKDPAAMRYIKRIDVSDPFILRADRRTGELLSNDDGAGCSDSVMELEYVRIQLDGQSFVLNQIRKMIGNILGVVAAGLDAGFVRSTLDPGVRRGVPMAPANGLFLVNLFFDKYNYSLARIQSQGSNAQHRKPVEMSAVGAADVDKVRAAVVSSILREEVQHDLFGRWLRGMRFITRLAWEKEMP